MKDEFWDRVYEFGQTLGKGGHWKCILYYVHISGELGIISMIF